MKSNFKPIVFFGLFVIMLGTQCNHSDDESTPFTDSNVKDFVWKGLNSWYYWQEEVANLHDDLLSQPSYLDLINTDQNPQDFFYQMLNDYPNTDRFSWIVSDYDQLLSSFQGTATSFGFGLGLAKIAENSEEVVAYVQYVIPNS